MVNCIEWSLMLNWHCSSGINPTFSNKLPFHILLDSHICSLEISNAFGKSAYRMLAYFFLFLLLLDLSPLNSPGLSSTELQFLSPQVSKTSVGSMLHILFGLVKPDNVWKERNVIRAFLQAEFLFSGSWPFESWLLSLLFRPFKQFLKGVLFVFFNIGLRVSLRKRLSLKKVTI